MRWSGIIILTFLIVLAFPAVVSSADYRPVLSGEFEVGDRLYTDVMEDLTEEKVDEYFLRSLWFKYHQQLDVYEYYYIRFEYEKRDYFEDISGSSSTLALRGNYTYNLREDLKNRWVVNARDKDYINDSDRSYFSLRLKYQLDYEYNERHDCSVYLQRQMQNYIRDADNDNVCDRISCTWNHEVGPQLELDSTISLDRERYEAVSDRNNKYGRRFSVGFDYEL
ncbi:MAG: hypothetical protein ACOCQC_03555 [Halanaerobiaceae bacterium]